MKINQKKAGIILTYLAQAIHTLSALIYTPIMLRLLGQSEYGLYQLSNSIVSYLGLLSFGFSSAYMRFYAKAEKSDDPKEIPRLNGMFMIIFTIITILCLVCGGLMILNIEAFFDTGLTTEEYAKARILMFFMVLGLSTTLFGTVYTSNMTAHEEFFYQRLLNVLQNLFNPFITLPLLLLGYGSVAMVCVSTSLVFAKFVASVIFCKKKLHIAFRFDKLNFSIFKEIGTFTFFIFLNEIIDKVNWSLDKVLLGRFCGTIEVAIYGVASNLHLMFQNILNAISTVFIPQVNRIVQKDNDNNQLTKLFIKVGRIQFILAMLFIIGFAVFGQEFILLWAKEGYDKAYLVALLLIIPSTMELIQSLGIEIQKAKNKHRTRSIVYFFISIGNVAISIPLIKRFGATGAAIGTAIAMFCGTWVFMNFYYHFRIGLNIKEYWKNMLSIVPATIPGVIAGGLIYKFANVHSWMTMFFYAIILTIIYGISIYLFALNKEEKDMLLNNKIVNKIIKRKT